MRYLVTIKETLGRAVCVEASSEYEAMNKVQRAYDEGEIVLDADDFIQKEIQIDDTIKVSAYNLFPKLDDLTDNE